MTCLPSRIHELSTVKYETEHSLRIAKVAKPRGHRPIRTLCGS
jgi:hypothetical protein